MNVNPHLRNLDYVISLAQAEANSSQKDQAIYKTKDIKRYDIFQFIPEAIFKGTAVRIVQFARNDKREDVLQDIGNEQPITVGKGFKSGKGKRHKPAE